MKRFVSAVLIIIWTTAPLLAQGSEPAYTDYPMPFVTEFVSMVNLGLQKGGSTNRIVSYEVIQRVLPNQRTRSVRGHFSVKCEDGSVAETSVITSLRADAVPTAEKLRLTNLGFVPAPTVDHAINLVGMATGPHQLDDLKVVVKYILGACLAKSQPGYRQGDYNLAVSLWVRGDGEHQVGIGRISQSTFESLK